MILQRLCRLWAVFLLLGATTARGAEGDAAVLAAYDAFQQGNSAKLEQQGEAIRGHVLEPYYEYWRLVLRIAGHDDPRLLAIVLALASYPVLLGLRNAWFEQYTRDMDFRWEALVETLTKLVSFAVVLGISIATG